MSVLDTWAALWGVPAAAVLDLRQRMGVAEAQSRPAVAVEGKPGSEGRQQARIMEVIGQHGMWLTRNNVGALIDERGVPVRYGLANENKQRNEVVKSADLIGIRPLLIGPQHMGQVIGQFLSVECKHEGWTFKGDKHEIAQRNWLEFVVSKGGYACFATGPEFLNQPR